MVINKLKMIRDAEVAYLGSNGKYTSNFDSLISFIDTGSIYITQRREEIEMLAYGAEKVTIIIDTIGKVSVKDSVFVEREPILSLAEGTIQELNIRVGSQIKRGDVLGTIISNTGKPIRQIAQVSAVVEKLNVKEGQQVEVNQSFGQVAYARIGDINRLPFVPWVR